MAESKSDTDRLRDLIAAAERMTSEYRSLIHLRVAGDATPALGQAQAWDRLSLACNTVERLLDAEPRPPLPACPECVQGKHVNCTTQAWDPATDDFTECGCYVDGHPKPVPA